MSLERLEKIEAELAIRNVIARYGMAADCGDIQTALACHTKDAVYIVSNPHAGRDGEALPDCAHTVGPLMVEVESETATVTGYSRVYHEQKLMRVAINHWTMHKDGSWKIARRESRVIGEEAAQNLLKQALNS